jgi:hypothetical protein
MAEILADLTDGWISEHSALSLDLPPDEQLSIYRNKLRLGLQRPGASGDST